MHEVWRWSLGLTLVWFFFAQHNMWCVLVTPGHTESRGDHASGTLFSPSNSERFLTCWQQDWHHCQARSLSTSPLPGSITGCTLHVWIHAAQPGFVQGVVFLLLIWYTQVLRVSRFIYCFFVSGRKTCFLVINGPTQAVRRLLGLILPGWKREKCHTTSQPSSPRQQD